MRRNAFSIWAIIAVMILQQSAFARIAGTHSGPNDGAASSILPGAGSVFEDYNRGIKIVRVTDNRDGYAAAVASLRGSSFNADSSHFFVKLDGVATLYGFDAARLKIQKGGRPFDRATTDPDSAQWSASDPEMIIGLESAAGASRIQAYDIRTRS